MMTPEEKALVQSTFAQLVPIADQAASLFYARMFEMDPGLRPLFRSDMREQGKKLMQMIGACVNGLDALDQLVPTVKDLAWLRLHPRRAGRLDDGLHRARHDDEGGCAGALVAPRRRLVSARVRAACDSAARELPGDGDLAGAARLARVARRDRAARRAHRLRRAA